MDAQQQSLEWEFFCGKQQHTVNRYPKEMLTKCKIAMVCSCRKNRNKIVTKVMSNV